MTQYDILPLFGPINGPGKGWLSWGYPGIFHPATRGYHYAAHLTWPSLSRRTFSGLRATHRMG
jgi:hypothetical protein